MTPPASRLDPAIARLVEQLRETDEQLEALLGGTVDSVTASDGRIFLLQRAQVEIHRSEAKHQEAILAALPANVVLLDSQGTIVRTNAAWNAFAADNGMSTEDCGLGSSYLDACDACVGEDRRTAAIAAEGIRAILAGRSESLQLEYACHSPTEQRWFSMQVCAMRTGAGPGAVVMHHDITRRIQAARDLARLSLATERRERMLNTALSAITDFTYIVDAQGCLLFANQGFLDLWDLKLEDVVGRNARDLGYPAEMAEWIDQQVKSVFATGKAVSGEVPHLNRAGEERFYAYELSAALAPDGSVDFLVGCTRDITQKKLSDVALQDSLAEFRTLASAIPQIVWVTTAQREAIDLNQQWTDYTGRSKQEALGRGWQQSVHPDDIPHATQSFETSGTTHSYEARLRRADGAYRWWLMRAVAVTDQDGEVLKWIGTSTDIDDIKRAEIELSRANSELRRQQAELRVVLDLVPAMIWFKDTRGNILRVNERAATSMGRSVAEVEGTLSIESQFPADVAAEYRATDLEIMRTGQPIYGVLERQVRAGGRDIWLQRDKVPLYDEHGQVAGIVVMKVDVTDRKHDQDALRELNAGLEDRVRVRTAQLDLARADAESANRAKSEFLATMSHEIRTPMSGLLGLLELLSLGRLDSEQRSTLAVARESGDALMHILNDILDFSKIEANGLELNLVGASVPVVVANVCRLHAQVAAGKKLALGTDVSPLISPVLSFDPLRLAQILNNFLNNAIKFTASGSVSVSVDVVGRHDDVEELCFRVRDTGIGMTRQQVTRLFQPFVQASSETAARFGGTGLGLVISRRLADLMGGTVEVESEPGVGTCLSLRVPFEVCEATVPPCEKGRHEALEHLLAGRRSVPSREAAELDGSLLLIVDDHPTNRLVLMRQAASLGYASEAVADGEQALQAWRSGRFGAVITDCSMPVMNGYQLTGAIRAAELAAGSGRVPIIACTANALPSAVELCLGCGMDDCLIKPASLADLGAMLARWVPLSGQPRAAARAVAQQTSAPSRGEGLLDLSLLAGVSGDDASAQAELLMQFRQANDADAAALRQAVADGKFVHAAESSHRIRGSCLMVGATLLVRSCVQVEASLAPDDPAQLEAAMASFESELQRLNAYLETFVRAQEPDAAELRGR